MTCFRMGMRVGAAQDSEGKKTSRCGRIERKRHESVLSPHMKPLVYIFKKFMLHETNK